MSTTTVREISGPGSVPAGRDGRRLLGSRPGRLRLIATGVVVAITLAGVVGFIVASQLIANTDRIEGSTGRVLIATQEMFASLAEADAAATAVHLSGAQGDREQRALYERAIARASTSLESVARLVGDDEESHRSMAAIAESLTRYAGIIEASRVLNEQGIVGADEQLLNGINLVRGDISRNVQAVTLRAQQRLDEEITGGAFYRAIAVYVLAVLVLVAAMVYLASRFRRILNLPLFLSGAVTIAVVVFFGSSYFNQQAALENARDGGYEAIRLTSEIQSRAFRYKADESLALIAGTFVEGSADRSALADEIQGASGGLLDDVQLEADSVREQAAALELELRWRRYRSTGLDIEAAIKSGNEAEAANIASGSGNSAFNGFNTAVESVLSDNQDQFLAEVQQAGEALRYLRWAVVGGAVVAALLAWAGFTLRIREYQ